MNKYHRLLVYLIILSAIFLLNDFVFINIKSSILWFLVDYIFRIIVIGVLILMIKKERLKIEDLGFIRIKIDKLVIWIISLSILSILLNNTLWRILYKILPKTQQMFFPSYDNNLIKVFDLSIGIMLVAFTEEIVFRSCYLLILKDKIKSNILIIIISCIVFGMIHWSLGLHAIVAAAIWGIMPMVSLIATNSIWPAIVAHYLTDFVAFSGIIPENWFKFIN